MLATRLLCIERALFCQAAAHQCTARTSAGASALPGSSCARAPQKRLTGEEPAADVVRRQRPGRAAAAARRGALRGGPPAGAAAVAWAAEEAGARERLCGVAALGRGDRTKDEDGDGSFSAASLPPLAPPPAAALPSFHIINPWLLQGRRPLLLCAMLLLPGPVPGLPRSSAGRNLVAAPRCWCPHWQAVAPLVPSSGGAPLMRRRRLPLRLDVQLNGRVAVLSGLSCPSTQPRQWSSVCTTHAQTGCLATRMHCAA